MKILLLAIRISALSVIFSSLTLILFPCAGTASESLSFFTKAVLVSASQLIWASIASKVSLSGAKTVSFSLIKPSLYRTSLPSMITPDFLSTVSEATLGASGSIFSET